MAKVGLKHPVYAKATETESAISYTGGKILAKAITANIKINTNKGKLPGDDEIAESDHSFSSGTVSMEHDDLPDFARVDLLGNTEGDVADASIGTKVITAGAEDDAPFVGFGFYGKKIVRKIKYWRAIWLKKVQFSEPADDMKTKGESVEFGTTTIEGDIFEDVTGNWKEEATFSSEALAINWLDGKCGLATKVATPVSSVASGTYTSAQSVVLTCATAGSAIYYTTDGTIPSATNGTLYSTAIALADPSNTCIKAIATKALNTNSDIVELYVTVTA